MVKCFIDSNAQTPAQELSQLQPSGGSQVEDRCSGGLGLQGEARDHQVPRKGLEVLARTAPQSLRAPVSCFNCPSDFGELRGAFPGPVAWAGFLSAPLKQG